jgi:hypothetical protein
MDQASNKPGEQAFEKVSGGKLFEGRIHISFFTDDLRPISRRDISTGDLRIDRRRRPFPGPEYVQD